MFYFFTETNVVIERILMARLYKAFESSERTFQTLPGAYACKLYWDSSLQLYAKKRNTLIVGWI